MKILKDPDFKVVVEFNKEDVLLLKKLVGMTKGAVVGQKTYDLAVALCDLSLGVKE